MDGAWEKHLSDIRRGDFQKIQSIFLRLFLTRVAPRLSCVGVCEVGMCTVGLCEICMCTVGMCKVGICKGASRTVKELTGELLPLAVSTTLEPENKMEGV